MHQGDAVQTRIQLRTVNADPNELWRSRLGVGDVVWIRSASAGGWVQGKVTQTAQDRVKVAYIIAGDRCDKNLLRNSLDLQEFVEKSEIKGAALQAQSAKVVQSASPHAAARGTPTAGYNGHINCADALQVPLNQDQQQHKLYEQHQNYHSGAKPSRTAVGAEGASLLPKHDPNLLVAQAPGKQKQEPISLGGQLICVADLQFGDHLGSGGFGSVYSGHLRGEEVAIKRLHLQDGCRIGSEQLTEFEKELNNLQKLKHPRLIRFIGVALEPPMLCLVTELAPGGSLCSLLHVRCVPLPGVQKRMLVCQISDGVAFLHSRCPPFVHRDLKSPNVVLDGELNAKLCDFGLTESMEKTHISRREEEGGSPRYMAPEIFDARSKLTEKLDIWALGCLVVEILTRTLPHNDCNTIQQVAAKLLVKQLPPFESGWTRGFHPEVCRLVFACFARDPSVRPTAAELVDKLGRYLVLVDMPELPPTRANPLQSPC